MWGCLGFGLSSLMVGLYAFVHTESFAVTICEEVMYAFVFRCRVSSCFSCSRCHSHSYAFLRCDHWGSRSVQRGQTLSRSSWLWGRKAKAGLLAVLFVCLWLKWCFSCRLCRLYALKRTHILCTLHSPRSIDAFFLWIFFIHRPTAKTADPFTSP